MFFSVDQDEMRIHINTIPPEFRSSSFIDDQIGKSKTKILIEIRLTIKNKIVCIDLILTHTSNTN
jgi:hypothetical protein